jgi:UDP-glucose 4-epimerase
MHSKPKTVLVTGAGGLIGRELCRQLSMASIPFIALIRPGGDPSGLHDAIEVVEVDLCSQCALSRLSLPAVSAVVHLAQAENYGAFPQEAGNVASITLAATARLAELACAVGAERFVFASSGGIYGSGPRVFSENSALRPGGELGFYLAAKATAEQLLAYFVPHLRVVCLRYFFVFGPRQREQMLLSRLINSVRDETPITMAGSRGPLLNPIFVTDAARATLSSLSGDIPFAINVAGDEVLDLHALCDLIGDAVGRPPKVNALGGESGNLVADVSLMHQQLGRCEVSLAEGVRQCVNG